MTTTLRNALLLVAYCTGGADAFAPANQCQCPASSTTALRRNSPGFAGFSRDDLPNRGGRNPPAGRRPMDDPFDPSTASDRRGPPPRGAPRGTWEDPPSVDLNGRVTDRRSDLSRVTQSVAEDPRPFDMERRFSQPPRPAVGDPSMEPRRAWWDAAPGGDGRRIQGGSRRTYSAPPGRDASHTFLESDGRPIDVEMEVWDGPNNTPTKMKYYSEDGRMRPVNVLTENPQRGRGNTVSVRNTGPMEFPIDAGVSSVRNTGDGAGAAMRPPSGVRPQGLAGTEGAYLTEADLAGFDRPSSPSAARGERVQGGALRTFPLDFSVEAVQVTITSDGLPVNAKVELWGTSSHIKQVAEVYNDNGQTRPFAAIIDVPGGSNTIAVYNTGPMEYPIRVAVEPVARMDGWDGREEKFGGHLAPW